MGETPDAVRAEIAGTRDDMSQVLSAIEEKVSPSQAARRQAHRLGGRLSGIRTAVMGSVGNVGDAVAGATSGIADSRDNALGSLGQLPDMATSQTAGNPFAAGLIAFGVGLLLGSALPATDVERHAAAKVGEAAQPVVEQAQQAVQDIKEELQDSAQTAVGRVKDSAVSAAEQVKDQASSSANSVGEAARQAG